MGVGRISSQVTTRTNSFSALSCQVYCSKMPIRYTVAHKVDIVRWFILMQNSAEVTRLFGDKYPNEPVPTAATVRRIYRKYSTIG